MQYLHMIMCTTTWIVTLTFTETVYSFMFFQNFFPSITLNELSNESNFQVSKHILRGT